MKIKKLLVISLLFIVLLVLFNYMHAHFFQVNVVLYSAIINGLLASIVTTLCLILSRYFNLFNNFEKFLMALIFFISSYTYAISIPTVIDRSLSFYILEKLQQRGGSIRIDGFEQVFTEEYLVEHRLIDIRLTEQQESGTIRIENGCVRLTEWGYLLATFGQFFRQNLLPKKRLIGSEYSDDLTNPFRKSIRIPDYLCK